MGGFFEDSGFFEQPLSYSKNPPSSIFPLRRSKNPLPAFSGAEDRRTCISNLRSSAPKIEETHPSTILGFEEWVEDRTKDEGGVRFFKDGEGPSKTGKNSSIFRPRKTNNSPFPPSRPEERLTRPLSSSFDPPPTIVHQLSQPPRSGSSERYPTGRWLFGLWREPPLGGSHPLEGAAPWREPAPNQPTPPILPTQQTPKKPFRIADLGSMMKLKLCQKH